jgi:predicted transcriptional regulator
MTQRKDLIRHTQLVVHVTERQGTGIFSFSERFRKRKYAKRENLRLIFKRTILLPFSVLALNNCCLFAVIPHWFHSILPGQHNIY